MALEAGLRRVSEPHPSMRGRHSQVNRPPDFGQHDLHADLRLTLEPNEADMYLALEVLFGEATEGDIEIAYTEPGQKAPNKASRFSVEDLAEAVEFSKTMNIEKRNVYFGAALRKPGGTGRAVDGDFLSSPAIWIDVDDGVTEAQLDDLATHMPPSLRTTTGRHPNYRAQLFFVLDEPITDPEHLRRLNSIGVSYFRSDSTVVNPGRLMRVPGSIAWPVKPDRIAELTTLEVITRQPISILRFEAAYGGAVGALQINCAATPPNSIITTPRNQELETIAIKPKGFVDAFPYERGEDGITRDAFGGVVDGRDMFMSKTVFNALVLFIQMNGREPTPEQLYGLAWPTYERNARLRGDSLEQEGRGETLMQQKCLAKLKPSAIKRAFDEVAKRNNKDNGDATGNLPTFSANAPAQVPNWPDPVDLFDTLALPPMTLELLPGVVRRFVEQEAELSGADPAGIATAALTVIAATIPDRHKVQVKEFDTGWLERPCLWAMLSGESSTKKSPIITATTQPVRALQAKYFEDFRAAKQIAEMKNEPEPPPPHRLYVNDATIEALQRRMAENPHGLLTSQDELSGWLSNLDRYSPKDSARGDRAFCLTAFNGGPYTIDRVRDGTTYIENASMSVLGGIQPEIISRLTAQMGDDGLLQRFLICNLARPRLGADRPRDLGIDRDYRSLIDRLAEDASEGRVHVFDKDARIVINDFLIYAHELQVLEEHSRKLGAWCGKLGAQVTRLAITLHYAEANGEDVPLSISAETARRAAGLIRTYYVPHAIRFFTETIGENATDEKARWIADHILARGLNRITFRHLDRGGPAVKNANDRDRRRFFRLLESYGWVRPEHENEAFCTAWLVNPAIHDLFQERARSERTRRKKSAEAIGKNTSKASQDDEG